MVKASSCSFDDLFVFAKDFPDPARTLSYFQVEYGLEELRACWAGFVDSSDDYYSEFENECEVYHVFVRDLEEYIDTLENQLFY